MRLSAAKRRGVGERGGVVERGHTAVRAVHARAAAGRELIGRERPPLCGALEGQARHAEAKLAGEKVGNGEVVEAGVAGLRDLLQQQHVGAEGAQLVHNCVEAGGGEGGVVRGGGEEREAVAGAPKREEQFRGKDIEGYDAEVLGGRRRGRH